jgi:hypothetical protein
MQDSSSQINAKMVIYGYNHTHDGMWLQPYNDKFSMVMAITKNGQYNKLRCPGMIPVVHLDTSSRRLPIWETNLLRYSLILSVPSPR